MSSCVIVRVFVLGQSIVEYIFQVVELVVSKRSFHRVPLLIICSNEMEEKFLAMWIQVRMGKCVAISVM